MRKKKEETSVITEDSTQEVAIPSPEARMLCIKAAMKRLRRMQTSVGAIDLYLAQRGVSIGELTALRLEWIGNAIHQCESAILDLEKPAKIAALKEQLKLLEGPDDLDF